MSILSFDIGIKNLAFCLLCKETQKIKNWGIINISCDDICQHVNTKNNKCENSAKYKHNDILLCTAHSKLKQYPNKCKKIKSENSIYNIGKKMIEELDKYPDFLKCTDIIVENQPSLKNPTMKSIQMIVYSYFLIKNKNSNLEMINARNKLKVYKGPKIIIPYENNKKNKYKINKYLAIKYCNKMIENENKQFIDLYTNSKKKDDLADSYLQGIYYINLK